MAVFAYTGTDDLGGPRSGRLEAAGLTEAARALAAQGVRATTLAREDVPAAPKIDADVDAFIFFNRSLGEMSAAGIPLERAIRQVSGGMRRGRFRDALARVESALREGRSLEEAVANERAFPDEYRWMVRTGDLPRALAAVAGYAQAARRMKRAVVAAVSYPVAVLLLGLAATVAFVVSVAPVYGPIMRQLRVEEPWLLQAARAWGLWCLALPAAAVAMALAWRERLVYRLPMIGRIVREARVARFLRCLSIFLQGGAPLVSAVPVAMAASGSRVLREESAGVAARLAEGSTLAEALACSVVVTPPVVAQLRAGEEAGRLGDVVVDLAGLIEDETVAAAEGFYLVLRPTAIVVTGIVMAVLFVALASPYLAILQRVAP